MSSTPTPTEGRLKTFSRSDRRTRWGSTESPSAVFSHFAQEMGPGVTNITPLMDVLRYMLTVEIDDGWRTGNFQGKALWLISNEAGGLTSYSRRTTKSGTQEEGGKNSRSVSFRSGSVQFLRDLFRLFRSHLRPSRPLCGSDLSTRRRG